MKTLDEMIQYYINELEHYSLHEICLKPSADGWSIGQLCLHLINDTRFYLEQIKICSTTNEHANEEASSVAKKMFEDDCLPDEDMEGSAENANIPQPGGKLELIAELNHLKEEVDAAAKLISNTGCVGKTRHPGLQYFSANEWLQFAEMHFRHHLRQKKKIDSFLAEVRKSLS